MQNFWISSLFILSTNNFAFAWSDKNLQSFCCVIFFFRPSERERKMLTLFRNYVTADDSNTQSDGTACGNILVVLSWIVVILTMPFSLFVCFKVGYYFSGEKFCSLGKFQDINTKYCSFENLSFADGYGSGFILTSNVIPM